MNNAAGFNCLHHPLKSRSLMGRHCTTNTKISKNSIRWNTGFKQLVNLIFDIFLMAGRFSQIQCLKILV